MSAFVVVLFFYRGDISPSLFHFPIKMISSQPSSIKLKQNLVFLSGGLADSPALVVMVVDFPP